MGNYEQYNFGATVELSTEDPGCEKMNVDQLTDEVLRVLNNQLIQEVRDASALTADQKSFLLTLVEDTPQPTKTNRRTIVRKVHA